MDSNTSSTPCFPGVKLRDRVACGICNWILRHVASDWYASRIDLYIRLGVLKHLELGKPEVKGDVSES
jgi:hypothetical protein